MIFRHLFALLPLVFLLSSCSDQLTDSNTDTDNVIDVDANKKSPGDSANDLLSDENFKTLIVQIQYMEGAEPTSAALDGLEEFLGERGNKSSIEIRVHEPLPVGGKEFYSFTEIRALEDEHRTEYNRSDTIAVYYLYVDGGSEGDTENSFVLGAAYRNTSLVMFQKNIESVSGGLGRPPKAVVETTVLNHEFGHIMGLVDTGSEMQTNHKDSSNGAHCDNSNCLMHYTARTNDIATLITGGSAPELDQNCLDDLQANGGK
ncbi:MAG: hypothetical protein WD267_11435 [Balneolales bacterium]